MTAAAVVEFRNVGLSFGDHVVHRDISFSIFPAESVTILGPSGVGKTMIFKMLIGLIRPTSGEIYVLGSRVDCLREDELLEVRKEIGMVFQGAALFDSLSVYENIAYPLRETGERSESRIKQIVEEKLEVVGLAGIGNKFPVQLSGGQKKRVGLARALATSPLVMLFDEPTTGLDPTSVRLIDDLVIRLKQQFQITSVAITHDIASARRTADRWMLVNDGRVMALGDVSELIKSNQAVKDFIQGNWS